MLRNAPSASRFMSSALSTNWRETLRFTCAQTVSSGFRCGEYGGRQNSLSFCPLLFVLRQQKLSLPIGTKECPPPCEKRAIERLLPQAPALQAGLKYAKNSRHSLLAHSPCRTNSTQILHLPSSAVGGQLFWGAHRTTKTQH